MRPIKTIQTGIARSLRGGWLLAPLALLLLPAPASAEIDFGTRTGSGAIRVAHSGMCLAVPRANPAETVQIEQQPCSGAPEQTWRAQPVGNGFNLVNQATGLCL